jgi:hypothetical protein
MQKEKKQNLVNNNLVNSNLVKNALFDISALVCFFCECAWFTVQNRCFA